MITLDDALFLLSVEQVEFLHRLVGLKGEPRSPDPHGPIRDAIHDLYEAPVRQRLSEGAEVVLDKVRESIGRPRAATPGGPARGAPSYSKLLRESARELGVARDRLSHGQQLTFVAHELILRALLRMPPEQRQACFDRAASIEDVLAQGGSSGSGMRAPLGTLAGLGLAQASGFGIYQAATTALGFATHAVGVTLPFAAYTGLTSTIAFLIGPAGFLAALTWAGVRATSPTWKVLHPAILALGSAMAEKEPSWLDQPMV